MTCRKPIQLFLAGLLPIVFLLLLSNAQAQVPIPALSRPVTDLTDTLTARQISRLEKKITAFESTHGSQLAVLLIPTTQPEDIAQFGIRVADAWKLGREKQDDGVILLVAKADRQVRIEVGYGLEGAIPDAIAKRIIEELVKPHFKQGDFYSGIAVGIDRLMALIAGEQLPGPEKNRPAQQENSLLLVLLVAVVFGNALSQLTGRPLSAMLSAAGALGVGMLWFSWSWLMAWSVGLMVFFFLLARPSRLGRWSAGGRGGFGGGAWGGGGGGFGGGGASGKW